MASLDELKERIRKEASDNPDKFFATDVLRENGFERSRCSNCGLYFWTTDEERTVCGEPECSGGYTFINNSPTSEEFTYIESWQKFKSFMADRGYTPIDRYPVIARWRDGVEFVGGSIYNFQPHVVSGEAEPPAEELVVPQPSLRFNDIDNVGITGRHYVLHNHIGQTCFKRENYDQDRYFRDMLEFAVNELGIPEDKLILHEDSWGGGGNLGACMEFFVDGLELWNQVYMFYSTTSDGYEDLDLKVLDMGMGQERITWISNGSETSYECVMPYVLEKMREKTGLETDKQLWQEFLPYSGYLNADEVDDLDEKWSEIAGEMDVDVETLKNEVKPTAALYSVAEHSKALLFALVDGKLPSNTGGGHNLRVIYRRSKDFIEKYEWDLDIAEIMEWHAEELEPMFPELKDSLDEVTEILEVEAEKYEKARRNAREKLSEVENPSEEKMIELYESHGVSPEVMEQHGIEVPEDFYSMVAEDTEKEEEEDREFDIKKSFSTEKLYYRDEKQQSCEAEVIETVQGGWIVLDRTVFYPEGGGQEPDHGYIVAEDEKYRVEDVQSQGDVVLHRSQGHDLEVGDQVKAEIYWPRRKQLMQHHSATHMVNYAAKDLFGNHIWQAGAHKTVEKGRLDITHYRKPSREQLNQIEGKVKDLITENMDINKEILEKSEAEKRYGFRIYQGGAAPGGKVRIVSIDDIDHEACGGTHLDTTYEAESFVITGAKKVQDGVIRLNYKAGEAAEEYVEEVKQRIEDVADLLRYQENIEAITDEDFRATEGKLCDLLSVDPEHLVDTVDNFIEEKEEMDQKIRELSEMLNEDVEPEQVESGTLLETAESLFESWKDSEKKVDSLENMIEGYVRENIDDRVFESRIPTDNIGLMIQVCRKLAKDFQASITLVGEKGAVSASYHEEFDADENLEKYSDDVEGDENFAKAFNLS